jgi:transposase-like protein
MAAIKDDVAAKETLKYKAEKRRRIVDEQASSGLNQSRFCRERGIALSAFCYWKRKFSDSSEERTKKRVSDREDCKVKPRGLVALRIESPKEEAAAEAFEVVLPNKHRIRIPCDFDEESFLRLLRIMRETC